MKSKSIIQGWNNSGKLSFFLISLLLGTMYMTLQTFGSKPVTNISLSQNGTGFIAWRLNLKYSSFQPYCYDNIIYVPVSLKERDANSSYIEMPEALVTISKTDGKPLWAYKPMRSYLSVVAQYQDLLFVHAGGSFGSQNMLIALDRNNGQGLWTVVSPDEPGRNELESGYLITSKGGAGSLFGQLLFQNTQKKKSEIQDSRVICSDPRTGRKFWEISLADLGGPWNNNELMDLAMSGLFSYSIIGNRVYLSTSQYLASVNLKNGSPVWINKEDGENLLGTDKPLIDSTLGFFGGNSATALNIISGKRIWNWGTDMNSRIRVLDIADDMVFISAENQENDQTFSLLTALNKTTGQSLWQVNLGGRLVEFVVGGNNIIAKTEKNIRSINLSTGITNFTYDVDRSWVLPRATGIVTQSSQGNTIRILSPRNKQEIGVLDLGSPIRTGFPCNDLLILSLESGQLVALTGKNIEGIGKEIFPVPLSTVDILENLPSSPLPKIMGEE